MAHTKTRLSDITSAVADRFVASANMKVGEYTLANTTMPTTPGARQITVTHTTVVTTDTLGTITVVGTDLRGRSMTEVITPVADSTATGIKHFVTVASVTGAGWVIAGSNDTIVVGCVAPVCVLDTEGDLFAIVVNTTAAGTITVTDATGAFATLKSSIAEGTYYYQCSIQGFLRFTLAAASNITIIHSPALPLSYA